MSVININSMYFFEKNDDVSDCSSSSSPAAVQMKWLELVLKKYQHKNGDHQVYIMGHVPPIDDDGSKLYKSACFSQYMDLLGKYGSVISGHFTGHTNGKLNVFLIHAQFYNTHIENSKDDNLNAVIPSGKKSYTYMAAGHKKAKKSKSALAKASVGLFNAPSIIPVNNPALRVYTYDTEGKDYPFGTIRNWEQYYIDLDKANNGGSADFQLEYTASELYGVDHFDGAGIGQAVLNIAANKKSRNLYQRYTKVSS